MLNNMNKIEKLIAELCPDGVEWKKLGEIGFFYNGLTGKNKNDFVNGNAKYVTYMNVYSNIEIDTNIEDYVKINENEQQNRIEYGDVLFTGSSETLDECGLSSVLTKHIDEPLYLNSFCFGFRLYDKSIFLPGFLKYLFRSAELRKQIVKTANGVTRFNVSKKLFAQITIPIPPLPIQEEIVKILDTFTALEAELEAELEARRKQYEYYRNTLLTPVEHNGRWYLNGKEVEWKKLGEIGTLIRGSGLQKKDFTENGVGCIHYGQIYTYYGTFADRTISFVSETMARKLKKAQKGDVLISGVSENIEDICKPIGWLGDEICISGDMFAFRHNQNTKYITYLLQTNDFKNYKRKYAQGTKVIRVKPEKILNYNIPIPPLSEQERIVAILDKFDALVNDISQGLPAEIEARRKQYEYYRNKLLNFSNR